MQTNLEDLDLNLLKLLRVVVETRNTSTAADKLGISQTSVSRGLAKLRETFGDQLFIRKAHGVEPSELAEKLAEAAENMLTPFANVLDSYQSFDPLEYSGRIVIAVELSLLETFGQGIYRALNKALPNACLELIYWQEGSLQDILERKIDYMVHYSPYPLPQELYVHHLSIIKVSLVARKNHPVLSQTNELDAIAHLPLVKLVSDAVNIKHDPYDELYLDKGYTPKVALRTHSIPIAIDKLEHSDAIKFSSSYIMSLSDKLACYPLPKIPANLREFSISGSYLQSKRGYPLNQHLHQTMQSFFDSVIQPPMT
ncbi:LysR family transcriptional regulator [Photobacterium gaetbulicola]|uniref:LysR family transcriptional regulator n=2 Tax=Photobacterium gaetbulicola TaxID=1295392 RepID=A0A0C5WDK3_9GAMM|nr:LysR family transcriptional regulator [Photobacterium gaetbulicola]AJR05168.1 LysR family transcriptional regulator [Photobacterium gaetbulicola Gung47]KHT64222.1 transcriptional regulator [Photobacterium gaetbulicola]PSU06810.1 LysR family transcriptional regulator [Photobacterium gaetbulicola]